MADLSKVFVGDGEMARLMRVKDWSKTPLGPAEDWPETLKVALRILLTSRFEMWLGWGPDVAVFYNDAYRPTLGSKHPESLGMPTAELWAEIWDDVKPRVEAVYQRGESTWDRALQLLLVRRGYPEETYHTFSYSPLIGDTGRVEGLFCAVSEETERVISERRLGALRALEVDMADARDTAGVLEGFEQGLARNPQDLPFALIYLFKGQSAHLAAAVGLTPGHPAARLELSQGEPDVWPLWSGGGLVSLEAIESLPTGAWKQPPSHAALVSLTGQGGEAPIGTIVVGLNPHRPFDEDYRAYLSLMAGQIASALASAEAHEAERRRAAAMAEAAQLRQQAADALEEVNARLAFEVERTAAERDRLRHLFQRAPGFMTVLSGPDHVFEFMNEAYLQLVGHRDLVGLPVRKALPEVEGQGFFEILDNVYHTGAAFVGANLPVQLQRTLGEPPEQRFISLVYQPITEGDGAITGIFAQGSDVTEQVRAEQELRSLNETLEGKVEQRTRELMEAEEALRQAQKMEAVGQLTGGIAHDFNNLLTGITGSLELMQSRLAAGRTESIDRYVAAAQGAAKRAAALTHRLLAFSRRQTLDPKPTNVNRLVGDMEDLIRRTIGPHIELEVVGAGGLWPTLVDPPQLENALLNLCINARDAMPDGGRITIETANKWLDERAAGSRDLPPGQYLSICVTDTGTGMLPDVISRAFDPFFTTKPIGMGTGLGLSMIYGFVRQSGGQVRIYSEVGQGTTMCLYLPRYMGNAEEGDAFVRHAKPMSAPQGETVLVVDDEPTVRMLVTEVLEAAGYTAIEVSDGPAGLKVLESDVRIDLLVTDVGLPGGMNGRQVADAGRALRPKLKVLFITGYAENAVVGNGHLEAGMAVLTKPFEMEALGAKIREMVES